MSSNDVIVAARMSATDRQIFKAAAARDGMALSTWLKFLARQRVSAMGGSKPPKQMPPLPETDQPVTQEPVPDDQFQSALQLLDILSEMKPAP